jgi:hypothetical protein
MQHPMAIGAHKCQVAFFCGFRTVESADRGSMVRFDEAFARVAVIGREIECAHVAL